MSRYHFINTSGAARALPLVTFAATTALALAACGDAAPLAPLTATCTFDDVVVLPATGAGPLHRMTPIEVSWRGNARDVAFAVRADGHEVDGEVWDDDGRAMFLASEPLPASAHVSWTIDACDGTRRRSGAFTTGALLHPRFDIEQCVDKPYALDLRRASLATPSAGAGRGDVMLKLRIATAMFITLDDFAIVDGEDAAVFWLMPARQNDGGALVPDFARQPQIVVGNLATNPYVTLRPRELMLALGGGEVTLRDVELVVGVGEEGYVDGRLAAVVDTRALDGADDPCGLIERLTDDKCFPCDGRDGTGSCFFLEMTDVVAVPADVDLARLPRDHVSGAPPPQLPVGLLVDDPALPAPLPPLLPCADPQRCPPPEPTPPPPPNPTR